MSRCIEVTTQGRRCKNAANYENLCTQHYHLRQRAATRNRLHRRAAHHIELLGIIRCLLNPDKYTVTRDELRAAYEKGRELLP